MTFTLLKMLIAAYVFLSVVPASALSENAPNTESSSSYTCPGFAGWNQIHKLAESELVSGCLTVNDGQLQFSSNPNGTDTPSMVIPIADLAKLVKKRFKYWQGFQFVLKNGKKYEFYPFYDKDNSSAEQAAASLEKVIRDAASQRGIILK
jgi:hypothetical protein